MNIHLVTVIGDDVRLLPHMLRHYRRIGIDSFIVNVHLKHENDPIIDEARRVTDAFGCGISSISIGEWSDELNSRLYSSSKKHADDWYVIADLDEFHIYPANLRNLIETCGRKGYDYIEGCFIDRIAADGRLPEIESARAIEDQCPLGCVLTYSILGGYPLKVVAARGGVSLAVGNHYALGGKGCPIDECFVQVHHYKWLKGVVTRLKRREDLDKGRLTDRYRRECRRFLDYLDAHDERIDVSDSRLMAANCNPGYQHWPLIVETVRSISRTTGNEGG